jgi:macrolide transport system ATP-binding/permease protein
VLIACVGLYGAMALGAERRGVIWMVWRDVLTLAALGLAIGLPAAWMTSGFVETFLFGMKARDPLAMMVAPAILLVAAIAAGYGPAWRASRIQPMAALRNE